MPTQRSQPEAESEDPVKSEDFWPALRKRIAEQIKNIDHQVDELWHERDRLQNFLNDHKDR